MNRPTDHHDVYISPEEEHAASPMTVEEFQNVAFFDKDDAVREWMLRLPAQE